MDKVRTVVFHFISKEFEEIKKIYIIDDDDDLREALSWALGREGFEIYSFDSPHGALDCLKLSSSLPDLILVDYHMREMNGGEFIERKKNILKNINCSVIMISASPEDIEKNISREDYQDILVKPIDLNGLVSGIRKSFLIPPKLNN